MYNSPCFRNIKNIPIKNIIPTIDNISKGIINNGDNTQNYNQSIISVSFNTIKAIVNIPVNPVPNLKVVFIFIHK